MAPSAEPAEVVPVSKKTIPPRLFSLQHPPSLTVLEELTSRKAINYPLSAGCKDNIPIYDLSQYNVEDNKLCGRLQDEWHHVLLSGPGVFILRNFMQDDGLLDRVNDVYNTIIEKERATSKGDHFAAAGSNSRIWNSFQKHAERHPESFVHYYSNPWLVKVSEAWLGTAYQITAQVNVVHPSGKPQMAHRDYHLGFQTNEGSARFPKSMHMASQHLTLQGAVAHSDMPLISGPTRFLPFSQLFEEGFMAYRLPEFSDYFEKHWVSAPLHKGDAVFFNPALFHAAGQNDSTDIERSANLLQVSSAFGRTMETINTKAMVEQAWPHVVMMHKDKGRCSRVEAAIKAIASGYPFPTNLDHRQPQSNGMAPESEQEVLWKALEQGWTHERTMDELEKIRVDSRA